MLAPIGTCGSDVGGCFSVGCRRGIRDGDGDGDVRNHELPIGEGLKGGGSSVLGLSGLINRPGWETEIPAPTSCAGCGTNENGCVAGCWLCIGDTLGSTYLGIGGTGKPTPTYTGR